MFYKNCLIAILKEIDLVKVKQYSINKQQKRRNYIIKRLNKIWLINNYLKIKIFDIKIYININIYLQYIVWIYINIIVQTTISILKQYLNLIAKIKYLSKCLRVDRENKIIIIENIYYKLFANARQDLELLFKYCFYYSISIKNIQIEK